MLFPDEYAVPVHVVEQEQIQFPIKLWDALNGQVLAPVTGAKILIRNVRINQDKKEWDADFASTFLYVFPGNTDPVQDALLGIFKLSGGFATVSFTRDLLLKENQGLKCISTGVGTFYYRVLVHYQLVYT
jgi:hypothetical protein